MSFVTSFKEAPSSPFCACLRTSKALVFQPVSVVASRDCHCLCYDVQGL